ncbi:MAG: oligosaccharide flippase family protein [Solirubrobacteraceae bacterium]
MNNPTTTRWTGAWLRDSGLMLISQGVLTATAALVMILLARGLSAYQFGLFSSLLSLSLALSFVVDSGLTAWILREGARIRQGSLSVDEQDTEIIAMLESAMRMIVRTGILLVITVVGISLLLHLETQLALAQGAFMAYVAILAGAITLEASLRVDRELRHVITALFTEKLSLLVLVIVALVLGAGVLGIAIAHVLAGSGRFLLDYRRTLFGRRTGAPKIGSSFALIKVTAPFAMNSAAITFLPRLDTALVGTISVISASYFALGFQIVTTAALVPFIASTTLYPFLSRTGDTQADSWRIPVAMGVLGVAAGAIGLVLAPWAVPFLFGDKYTVAVGPVQIMLLAIPPLFFASPIVPMLYTRGRETDALRCLVIPAIIGTVLVVIGQIRFGTTGASAGYAARYFLQALMFIVVVSLSKRRDRQCTIDIAESV